MVEHNIIYLQFPSLITYSVDFPVILFLHHYNVISIFLDRFQVWSDMIIIYQPESY
jgi:hypothetical protein